VGVGRRFVGRGCPETGRCAVKISLKTPFLAAIAIGSGLVVLLGYFLPGLPYLSDVRNLFLDWAVVLFAVALWVGVFNLTWVHWRKVRVRQPGAAYSVILLISFLITIAVLLIFRPDSPAAVWLFDAIIVPAEASLMALLAVVLVYMVARMFSRQLDLYKLIFVGTILFLMFTVFSLPGLEIPGVRELRSWLVHVWSMAGARGILLGVALGTIATGLRILMGSDRPYGG
jgi:hypothetical protein